MSLSPRRFYFVSGKGPQPWGSLQSTPDTGKQFRNFRTNSGTTDYVAIASTTPAEIEMTVYPVSGASNLPGSPAVTLLKLQTIRYAYAGGAITQLFNGFRGIVSDLKFYNASGVLINFWPMNEGSGSTHIDTIGGNNGSIINGQASDWELFERLPGSVEWVGPELVTGAVWDAPFQVGSQWAKDGDYWVYTGDGTLNALQLLATAQQPDVMRISGAVERSSGSGSLRLSSANIIDYAITDAQFLSQNPYAYSIKMVKSIAVSQSFIRREGILSARLSRPSLLRILEIA